MWLYAPYLAVAVIAATIAAIGALARQGRPESTLHPTSASGVTGRRRGGIRTRRRWA